MAFSKDNTVHLGISEWPSAVEGQRAEADYLPRHYDGGVTFGAIKIFKCGLEIAESRFLGKSESHSNSWRSPGVLDERLSNVGGAGLDREFGRYWDIHNPYPCTLIVTSDVHRTLRSVGQSPELTNGGFSILLDSFGTGGKCSSGVSLLFGKINQLLGVRFRVPNLIEGIFCCLRGAGSSSSRQDGLLPLVLGYGCVGDKRNEGSNFQPENSSFPKVRELAAELCGFILLCVGLWKLRFSRNPGGWPAFILSNCSVAVGNVLCWYGFERILIWSVHI